MESIELVERIIKNINSFSAYRVGDVIIAFIALAVLFALALKAIYITSIEEFFMNEKQKIVKGFFVLMYFLTLFTVYNLILLIFPWLLIIDGGFFVLGSFISFILYLCCCFGSSKSQSVDTSKKKIDCKVICNNLVLYAIIFMMPWLAAIIKIEAEKIPLINCVLIASVIGVILVYFSMPSLLIKRSSNYFMSAGQKIYIYKRIDEDSVLCGNDPTINKSEKYIIIPYEELKKKEIFHIKNGDLDKSEISEKETLKE